MEPELNTAPIRARIAANNNADLCSAIMKSHGIRFLRDEELYVSLDSPPPKYPWLITLLPQASARAKKICQTRPLGAVKDSFSHLDCAEIGFEVMFEASWIWRNAEHSLLPQHWGRISNPQTLLEWHSGWSKDANASDLIFPPECISDPSLVFLGRNGTNGVDAGCLANISNDAVGISNMFGINSGDPAVWEEALKAVASVAPTLPIVGYEAGQELIAATAVGFEEAGRLRVMAPLDHG